MRNSNDRSRLSCRRKKAKKIDDDDDKDRESSALAVAGPGINFNYNIPFLPDDLIEEIVSRLPIKDVLRFRCVSKSAFNLFSDRDFIDNHMKRGHIVPMVLVDHQEYGGPQLLDKWWTSNRKNRKNAKPEKNCHLLHPEYRTLLSSQSGLIVSKKERVDQYIIFNPIYSETMEISFTGPVFNDVSETLGEILGVFFRPSSVNAYSALWEFKSFIWATESIIIENRYKVIDLCSKSKWRTIKYPFFEHRRCSWSGKPVLINGVIYWICENNEFEFGIMGFDTGIEKFELIPCPMTTPANKFNGKNRTTSLLNGNGVLKLVQVLDKGFNSFDVNIWAINGNVKKKIWSSYKYRKMSRIGNTGASDQTTEIVALWNGELVLVVEEVDELSYKEIFVCNLKVGTTRKFGRRYPYNVSFMPHVMSLASIKNCKMKIAFPYD